MESQNVSENVDRTGHQTHHSQDEGIDLKHRRRCLVLIAVSLGLICVLLLIIILQRITITADRDLIKSYKNTVEEFNQTINSLQDNYTDLMTEKDQLQNNVISLSQKKLELEKKVNEQFACPVVFFLSSELKNWSDSRQYCRDLGADLIIINSEEKQRCISSLVKERVWIGLSDIESEGNMTWVDNSTLKQGFWLQGEPNNLHGNEDCIELMPSHPVLNNWNDLPCSEKRKVICEK